MRAEMRVAPVIRGETALRALNRIALPALMVFISSILQPCACLSDETVKDPVRIGLTAEFGLRDSFSAQAVELGIRSAILEINSRGGVLGGRPMTLTIKDDRSVPARAIENLKEFDELTDMTAVFGARFSPVIVEMLPHAHSVGMIILDPWGSADTIIKNNYRPNYVFRLSLTDTFAIEKLFSRAEERGFTRIGMMLPNTAWGRSNMAAAESYSASRRSVRIVRSRWYNWGDASLLPIYKDVREAGAEAVLLVANDLEGSILVNEVAGLPEEERAPILSHWGVTGGAFFQKTKDSLAKLDFEVVQTFSFFKADPEIRDRFMSLVNRLRPVESFERIEAPVGVGHAYDLTHLLALAIEKAGTVDRAAVRDALEDIGPYRGLTGFFPRPFTPENHDALSIDHVFMAKYRDDGVLVPITPETRP